MLLVKKSIKSLQIRLNEYALQSKLDYTITNSAFTQARQKLSYTAFKELDEDTVSIYYKDGDYKTMFGFRCIAGDCSTIILPKTVDTIEEFGTVKIYNNKHKDDNYVSAKFECYYDVLNRIVLKSQLASNSIYESELALSMINNFSEKDLLIYDRGYASYRMMSTLVKQNKNYLIRLPKNFVLYKEMLNDLDCSNKVVKLKITNACPKDEDLPLEIKVRLIKVILSTGETELLATSVMDEKITAEDFGKLYWKRWGVETFFSIIKGRLNLENFSGKTLESIKQDFWSTIFITNIETVMTEDTEKKLNLMSKDKKFTKQVNKAVSFNAIKHLAFDIFFNEKDREQVTKKLEQLFLQNAILKRPDRVIERRVNDSSRKSLNFQTRVKKQVF